MTENEHIEEMAEIISTACNGIKCYDCETHGTETSACVDVKSAEALYAKDYRKASEVAREIFEEIEEVLENVGYFDEIDFKLLKKKYTEGEK